MLLLSDQSNGICPRYCTCFILYEELIEDALKEISDDYYKDNEYPDYEEYMAIAKIAYWKAKSEQICCKLDNTIQLLECVKTIVHNFIRANGYADDEILAAYCGRGRGCTIDVPTQRCTQLTPESLSDDNEDGVYTQQLKTVSSSAKSVSYNKSIQEKQTLPLSPTRKPAYKSPIHKGFNEP